MHFIVELGLTPHKSLTEVKPPLSCCPRTAFRLHLGLEAPIMTPAIILLFSLYFESMCKTWFATVKVPFQYSNIGGLGLKRYAFPWGQ